MRIIYWTPYMGNVGTIKATIESAIAMKRRGHDTAIYKPYNEWHGYEQLIQDNGIEIIDFNMENKLPGLPEKDIGFRISKIIICSYSFFFLRKSFKRDKPDIIISSLFAFLPLLVRCFCRYKPKIIVSIQGKPRFNFIRSITWKALYKKADYIVTLTEETNRVLKEKFGFDKMVTVKNPIIDEQIAIKKEEEIADEWFDNKSKKILGIGRLSRQKDFITLLKAFRIVRETIQCKLIILGEGEERQMLEDFVNKNQLQDFVEMPGFVKNPYKYMRNCDVFVLSSLWEDQGHTLVEAANVKIPIVSTECPHGQVEFLDYGQAGSLCKISDERDMAEKITYVLNDVNKTEIGEMVEKAYRNSMRFTVDKHGEELEALLNKL